MTSLLPFWSHWEWHKDTWSPAKTKSALSQTEYDWFEYFWTRKRYRGWKYFWETTHSYTKAWFWVHFTLILVRKRLPNVCCTRIYKLTLLCSEKPEVVWSKTSTTAVHNAYTRVYYEHSSDLLRNKGIIPGYFKVMLHFLSKSNASTTVGGDVHKRKALRSCHFGGSLQVT